MVRTFFEQVDLSEPCTGYATLPYIKGITEPLSRTLRKHNIKVYNKPLRTLQREFPTAKHKPPIEEQTNVFYKIPCKDCSWNYIGKTSRSLKARKSEHVRNVKQHKDGSNIAKHSWHHDHIINFDNAKVIDKGKFRSRLTLESWHTAKDKNADNNSKPLPKQYAALIHKS